MKYIKQYESDSEEFADIKYWKISTKSPDLEISLKKIPNCRLKYGDFYDMMCTHPIFHYDYLYVLLINSVAMFGGQYQMKYWDWIETPVEKWSLSRKFENIDIIKTTYKGQIKVTKKDLEKFNLEKTANKFNI